MWHDVPYYEHNMKRERKSRAEKKGETRDRILASAGTMMKERGIAGASVAEVMGSLGLTVGGFYAHFASKDDMIDQSLRRAMAQRRQRFIDTVDLTEWRARLTLMTSRYLTKEHRADAAGGCPMPGVLADVARTGAGQAALGDEIAALVTTLTGEEWKDEQQARQAALAIIALTSGGVSLARALGKTSLSDEVLNACRGFAEQTLTKRK
jgi:TetR/AcrR family transcriptional regulator, transcriptional repressor for nem operon